MPDVPFTVIEKKINDLATLVAKLKEEKVQLLAQLEQKTAEARELSRKAADLARERDEVRSRVYSILSRLESIEL